MCLDVSWGRGPFSLTILTGVLWGDFKSCRPGSGCLRRGSFQAADSRIPSPVCKMPPSNVGQGTDPVVALVEAGQQVEFPASRAEEDLSALDADFFERLQAIRDETRADHIYAAHAVPAVVGQDGRGIGLYPFRPPKTGLEGDLPVRLGKLESLGKEARSLVALEMVGIPSGERVKWQAVDTHEQHVRTSGLPPMLAHEICQCGDVRRVVVKVLHQPDFRHVTDSPQKPSYLIQRACGRAGRVLGIHRQHEDALASLRLQASQRALNRGLAVAHGEVDRERRWGLRFEAAAKQSRLLLGMHPQGGPFRGPDAGAIASRPPRIAGPNAALGRLRHAL